jgi:hypothetical protein
LECGSAHKLDSKILNLSLHVAKRLRLKISYRPSFLAGSSREQLA